MGMDSGVALYWAGPDLHKFIDLAEGDDGTVRGDLRDLALDDAPRGLSVWEGTYEAPTEPGAGGCDEPVGAFRPLTDAEFEAVRRGENPWPDEVLCAGGCGSTCPLAIGPEGRS